MRAAEKLQAVLDRRGHGDDVAEMRVQLGRVIYAVKSTVPQEMWGAIVEKLDQPEQHPEVLDAETEDFDDDDDGDDPTEFAEEDDELWANEDGEAGYYDEIDGEDQDVVATTQQDKRLRAELGISATHRASC